MPSLVPSYPIRTERLELRPLRASDLDAFAALYAREDVTRYLYEAPASVEEAREVLERKIPRTAIEHEGDRLSLALVRADTGTLIGDVMLALDSETHAQGEIGFVVHPDHQGLGFATEAGRELLRLAFDGLGLHRVTGRLEARNAASARVLEKLGMRREAHLVENEWVKDEWQSELVYAILDREWRAASAP